MRKDLILHTVVGISVIPIFLFLLWVATTFGPLWAAILASAILAGGKEAQDHIFGTGTPDILDFIFTTGSTLLVCGVLSFFL